MQKLLKSFKNYGYTTKAEILSDHSDYSVETPSKGGSLRYRDQVEVLDRNSGYM